MSMNRTNEFTQLCRHLGQANASPTTIKQPTAVETNKQFNAAASDVSKEVYQAAKRLQQLTQLVRQNNMFNDPTAAINELASLVKKDITDINMQLDNLQEYINSQRSNSISKQASTHSDTIVSLMKSDLMATTRGFKDILEVRQENMKLTQNRKARYGKTASTALGKPLAFQIPNANASIETTEKQTKIFLPRPNGIESQDGGNEITPLIIPPTQSQMVIEEQNYVNSRAEAVSQIESHIVDIGQLFGRLSTMIHEQGDLVRRIDDNVDDTITNISSGENELLKYFSSLSNNRMLAFKVSAILFLFILFFIIFLA